MKKLGIGLIGCGNISGAYLKLAPLFEGLELRAVADVNSEAASARASEFGLRALRVDEMMAADDVDIVVNLTVPEAHFEVSKRVLESGKHVYSEKPFVLHLEEAEALAEVAASKGVRVGAAPDTFMGGAHQAARETIDAGAVGRIVGGTCHVMSQGMESWHPNPDFFFRPGGGPILDLGPYYITNLVQMIGPVRAVTAITGTAFAARTIGNGPRNGEQVPVSTPTTIHAVLEFTNGAIVTLGASWDVKAHRHKEMELYGSEGSLYVPDPNFFGGVVELADKDGEVREIHSDHHPFGKANSPDGDINRANYRCAGLADMAVAIQQARPHRCIMEMATHVVDVMTGILKAGETRQFVEMRTSCERPPFLGAEDAAALLVK
ncbi:MAG: Gfo/Idh/MocA family oxidoreductase [Bacteroidetes bacterium]|nr:Gfo/Idh/MocA family oxidoreductase [Bacteroidota bacterium]